MFALITSKSSFSKSSFPNQQKITRNAYNSLGEQGVINEVAVSKCGNSEVRLEQAVARGAVKVKQSNGIDFYYFPTVNEGSTKYTNEAKKMTKNTACTDKQYNTFKKMMQSLDWTFSDECVEHIGEKGCTDPEHGAEITTAIDEKLTKAMVDFDKIYKMAEAAKRRLPPLLATSTHVQKENYKKLDDALTKAHMEKRKMTFAAKHHKTSSGESLAISSANALLSSAAPAMNQLFDTTRSVKGFVPAKVKDE